MNTRPLAILFMAALAVPVWADAADDAEAKRRNIPVAQVQAERARAAEEAKIAALEAKLAGLNQQLAELEGKQAAANAAANAASPAGGGDAQALYRDVVRRYLAGDWDKLLGDIKAREKDFAGLPEQNGADIAYIKDAVTEARQGWWDGAKGGRGGLYKATLWKREVPFTYISAAVPKFVAPAGTNPAVLCWPKEQMDSFDALSMQDIGLALTGNFRKGDGINQLAWSYLSFGDLYTTLGADKIRTMNAADKEKFNVYGGFWSGVTAGYYGTPPARRLIMVQALASFEQINDSRPDWKGKRPIGSAVIIEMKVHKYPSLNLDAMTVIGLDRLDDPHQAELFAAKPMVLGLSGAKFTLDEDKLLRSMFKTLAESNPDWTVTRIALPNNLAYDFNSDADIPLAKERLKGGK